MSAWRLKGTAGALVNRSFPVADCLWFWLDGQGAVQVGDRAPTTPLARLLLDDRAQPRFECLARMDGLQLNGVDWSGGAMALGDELRIGTQRFLLQAPGLRPERVLAPQARVGGRRAWLWLGLSVLAAAAAAAWWWLGQAGP